MPNLDAVLVQLREERNRIDRAISALEGVSENGASRPVRREISAAGRRRIAAAQRARWAKARDRKIVVVPAKKSRTTRTMSPAARRRIAAAQRARWAAWRKKQKAA